METARLFKRAIGDLWHVGKNYYSLLFIQIFCQSSLTFLSFFYMSRLVNQLNVGDSQAITSLLIQYLSLFAVLQLTSTLLQPTIDNHSEMTQRKILEQPYEKMLRMQYHFADNADTVQRLERIKFGNLSRQSSLYLINVRIPFLLNHIIRMFLGLVFLAPLVRGTNLTAEGTWLWVNSPWILLIFVAGILLSILSQFIGSQKVAHFMESVGEEIIKDNTLFNYENDLLSDVESGKEIRLYQLEDKLHENQLIANEATFNLMSKLNRLGTNWHILTVVLGQLLNYAAYAIIGLRVLLGFLPIGQIIQLSSALNQVLANLPMVIQQTAMILSQPDTLVEYYAFMDLPEEQAIGSLPIEKRLDNAYQIDIKDLSFTYPGATEATLSNISASFDNGKKYAIVGENGSGKTTFIKLLMRLYDPSSGQINLNNIDSQKYKLTEYFQLFSVVFQDFRLLGLKLGQNVAVNQQYDANQALATLTEVGLEDYIETLPYGLETYFGKEFDNSGVKLSGGQAQKVAMSRALYKNAPFMILDEPTAALDPVAEFEIYQKFDEIVQNKTAFYISHRLSSCRFCDEILVFDQGRIIQRGSHQTLVNQAGKYQDLWQAQAQYYQ